MLSCIDGKRTNVMIVCMHSEAHEDQVCDKVCDKAKAAAVTFVLTKGQCSTVLCWQEDYHAVHSMRAVLSKSDGSELLGMLTDCGKTGVGHMNFVQCGPHLLSSLVMQCQSQTASVH